MDQLVALTAIAAAILGFGLVSRRAQAGILTPPLAFVAFGVVLGPIGFDLVGYDLEHGVIHALAELTLVLVLFTDASRIDLAVVRRQHDLPVRMLVIGLPLTIAAGVVAGLLIFPEMGFWQVAAIAAILAPTDAALAQAVVGHPKVPPRIRQALNIESGLNDGIALPVVLILASLAAVEAGTGGGERGGLDWAQFVALQVGLGPLVGIGVGWLGGNLVQRASQAGWVDGSFLKLSALGLALLAFAGAELVHGNGFIAAFCAGLAMGNTAREVCPRLHEFGETEGQLLALLTFMVFGVAMVPEAVEHMSWQVLIYAALSLTVIRMVPVALSLMGSKLMLPSILFLGWFGPRGLASILFALLVLEALMVESGPLLTVVVTTVSLSVLLHGLTAAPLSGAYGRACERMSKLAPGAAEDMPVTEMPLRLSTSPQPEGLEKPAE